MTPRVAGVDLSLTSTGLADSQGLCEVCGSPLNRGRRFCSPRCMWAESSDPAIRLEARSRPEGDCLIWTGLVDRDGYGRMRVQGEPHARTHRLVWILAHGPIPDGLVVRHRCDRPACIRVDHLELGTVADNNRDRAERGRSRVGSAHHSARLTPDQVRDIRRRTRDGESVVRVAAEYGVRSWAVQKIRDGITWRSVS